MKVRHPRPKPLRHLDDSLVYDVHVTVHPDQGLGQAIEIGDLLTRNTGCGVWVHYAGEVLYFGAPSTNQREDQHG